MILAEKIMMLRKRNGWSQEDLANELNISRQSVSKWESSMSVPDLDKILKLSELFGVTTDFLLKDEEEMITELNENESVRKITLEQAHTYLADEKKYSKIITVGIVLCILSPVILLFLSVLSEYYVIEMSNDVAVGLGTAALLFLIAAGVVLIVYGSMQMGKYEFLNKEIFALEYEVSGFVKRAQKEYRPIHHKVVPLGIACCIMGVIPLFLSLALQNKILLALSITMIFFMVALGVYLLVTSSSIMNSYHKLLQEGDYTPEKKQQEGKYSLISTIYWCTATAIYLGISFKTNRWGDSWIIWPVAGVFYAAVLCSVKLYSRNKR